MSFSKTLFKIQKFEFKNNHLLVIGILCLAFVISFLIRSAPIEYGFQLNEFDPFFNYRATQYLVENGLPAYLNWHDDMSWYSSGRDVSATSQEMLHITTAILYNIFGGGSSLYTFTIIFPLVIGSITAIVIFALVRTIGGTTAGLFASLLFAISPSIIVRGSAGWFKSEPLGLFYGLLGLYLFLSALKSNNNKISFLKLIGGGIFLSFGLASWGGIQFLTLPLGIFFVLIPFLRNDIKFTTWAIPLFTSSFLLSSLLFERPGPTFIFGLGGVTMILPSLFVIACNLVTLKSKLDNKKRNQLLLLISIIIVSVSVFSLNSEFNFVSTPSYRYFNALNPFLTTTDPLVDSVSEHASNSIEQSFFFLSFLMIPAALGIWFIFKNISKNELKLPNELLIFTLIFGLIGVYSSSAFIRLELFSSIAVIIFSSIGLSILISKFNFYELKSKKIITISFVTILIVFLASPLIFPTTPNWTNIVSVPPTIMNGGSKYAVSSSDWLDALTWMKNNTPKDSVIASWWDYGYWIQTLGERKNFVDNATLSTGRIQNIAQIFFDSPDLAWKKLSEMKANYVLIFISGQRLQTDNPVPLYILDGGGEESKLPWLLRISEYPFAKYIENDQRTGTDYFWSNTLLGNLIPYSIVAYTDFHTSSQTYQPGMFPVYAKNIKYSEDNNGPFRLVYASNSFNDSSPGVVNGVFIYEINPNYSPQINQ